MAIIDATSENFQELIQEGFSLVEFYSPTCVPCKAFAKTLEELNFDLPFVNFVTLNSHAHPQIAKSYKVMAVPTLVFIKDGQEIKRNVGAMSAEDIKGIIGENIY